MTILAIETATVACSVAILRGESVLASRTEVAPQRHAELLLPAIMEIMADAGVKTEALDAVAVSIGPGSFTGLRIGLSTAKGIAVGTGCRLIPIPSALAVAFSVFRSGERNDVSVVIPARKFEYYYARYGFGMPVPVTLQNPVALAVDDLLKKLDDAHDDIISGEGLSRLVNETGDFISVQQRIRTSIKKKYNLATADSIGLLAPYHEPVDVAEAEPMYIKHFQSGSVTKPV
jgi:tRNA threonylcarbamoyladenosine biosynthesis protein TsaB